jgi:hypothetical protein
VSWQNGATFPGALGSPFEVTVHSIEEISKEADIRKPKFEIQLKFKKDEPNVERFEAGDSFYVICPNTDVDVEFLLARFVVGFVEIIVLILDSILHPKLTCNTEWKRLKDPKRKCLHIFRRFAQSDIFSPIAWISGDVLEG